MKNKYNKSLGKNAFLSSLKTFFAIIFPLITYPYITRILPVEDIGKINFSRSVSNYFVLFGTFGISSFAIRNGSQLRDDNGRLERFSTDIFSINIITSLVAFFLLILSAFIPAFNAYRDYMFILSIEIIIAPIGVEWLFPIVEDFAYITLRSFIVQLLSLIALFLFVHDMNDALIYTFITVMAKVLPYIFNWFYSKKYIRVHFTVCFEWKKYYKQLLAFFVNSMASTVYLNSDTTMLGLFCNDYVMGIYGVSTRIYLLVKQIFNATIAALIPRMAYYAKNDSKKFDLLLKKVNSLFLLFIFPAVTGMIIYRIPIVYIIAGEKYSQAGTSMIILSCALFFATLGNIYANGVLISKNMEQDVLRGTIISSVVNIILNFFLLNKFEENGAAFTTLVSEIIMFLYCYYKSFCLTQNRVSLKQIRDPMFGSVLMVIIYIVTQKVFEFDRMINFILEGSISVLTYYIYLFSAKNKYCLEVTERFVDKITNRNRSGEK